MKNRTGSFSSIRALLLAGALAAAPLALADDPIKDIIDHEVPALKDGTRMPLASVEDALLKALAARKFDAMVESPGLITARVAHRWNSFEVNVPFTDTTYSVRYKDSKRMDYDPVKQRIDDSYNEWLEGLEEHIQAQLEKKLAVLKAEQKAQQKAAKKLAKK